MINRTIGIVTTIRFMWPTCFVVCVMFSSSLQALDHFKLIGASEGDEQIHTSFQFRGYSQSGVSRQDTDMQMSLYDFRLVAPLWSDEATSLDLTARISTLDMETHAWLPGTFDRLPDSLWDVRLGGQLRHDLDNGWALGGSLELGSAADRLFASADEWLVHLNVYLEIPVDDRDSWVFLLNSSNTRDFAEWIPLPGVGYRFDRGDSFRGLLGLPMTQLHYEPADLWAIDLTYVLVRTVHARVGYEADPSLELFAAFDWDAQTYFRHDRRDDDERLFYYEKRVEAGLNWKVREHALVTLAGGYAFDRFFFEGEDYDDRGDKRIDVGDGPFAQLRLNFSF